MSSSKLLELLLTVDEPLTFNAIVEKYEHSEEETKEELEKLLSQNFIRKREFPSTNEGETISIYWTPRLIPFADSKPIITSPFPEPFDHESALERLSDQQISQEKIWLQTKLRKLNQEYENLLHRSKHTFSPEKEQEIDDITQKWVNACQEMLYEMKRKLKEKGQEMSMTDLIKNLQIDPNTVHWDPEEEDFVTA